MRGVFCLFTSILSVFFVFHRKDLVLLNQIRRYLTSASEKYLKSIVDLQKRIDVWWFPRGFSNKRSFTKFRIIALLGNTILDISYDQTPQNCP